MKDIKLRNEEKGAIALLKSLPIELGDIYGLMAELVEASKGKGKRAIVARARQCIRMGKEAMTNEEKSDHFENVVGMMLESKAHLRPRTLADIRFHTRKLLRLCPELKKKTLRNISSDEWKEYLDRCFRTPSQFKKGRSILSSVLNYAKRRRLVSDNSTELISKPRIVEKHIAPLSLTEVKRLITSARECYNGEGLAACAIMLYAGVRPTEVQRLSWECINLKSEKILINPIHSKTGGCRQVTIQKVLKDILRPLAPKGNKNQKICPANWLNKWRNIRQHAGLKKHWAQDVLRHTFASYHLANFRNKNLLVEEMGHSTPGLINSRYVSLNNITPKTTKTFWHITAQ